MYRSYVFVEKLLIMSASGSSSPFFSPRRTRSKTPVEALSLKDKLEKNAGKIKSTRVKRIIGQAASIQEEREGGSQLPILKKDVNVPVTETNPKQAKWEPENWKEVLEHLRTMRKAVPAPVDTMGCHMCSDEKATPQEKRFHILIALMLSSQTKDAVTYEAMGRLRDHGLTPESISQTPSKDLEDILNPVSFYKNKAKFLIKTCEVLLSQYDGDIPISVENLIKLPGVGPKMAHICMNAAWGVVTGIGVDTHVHRISNRLGWVRRETKEPEKTRQELEKWVPFELWDEINVLLVGFGQTICTPTGPKCEGCLANKLCPSAFKKGKK